MTPQTRKGKRTKEVFNDYEGFVDKFTPKLTTDDCYTPDYIYDIVLAYALEHCDVPDEVRIVRPFWPGADYEKFDYRPGDFVVDNPPFSIVSKIRCFYEERDIPFFLFCPGLTPLGASLGDRTTIIIQSTVLEYENGAKIPTAFVTNIWKEDAVLYVAGDLTKQLQTAIKEHRRESVTELPVYDYPDHVVTPARLRTIAARGVNLSIPRQEAEFVKVLDSQRAKGKAIFGNGLIISERMAAERMAAERMAAERMAAERMAAEEKYVWELSDREWEIVRRLSANSPK